MNALFAAGLFDNPWIVLAIIIGSALANWLAKRRQEKQSGQQGQQSEGDEPSPPSSAPPGEFNLEETLRRLMGEEPPPPPVPPVIPRAARGELPPARTWLAEQRLPPEPKHQPAERPALAFRPPIDLPQLSVTLREANREDERRFEALSEQARHPAMVVTHKHQLASRSRPRSAAHWRDARSVRQAFVASLVFAPPKSIEP